MQTATVFIDNHNNETRWEKFKKGASTTWQSKTNQVFIYPGMQLLVGLGLIASAGLIAWERLNPNSNYAEMDDYGYLGSNDAVVATLVALAGVMLVAAAAAHWAKQHAWKKHVSLNPPYQPASVSEYSALAYSRRYFENRMMQYTGRTFVALGAFGLMLAMVDHTADTAGMTKTNSGLSFQDLSDSQEVTFLITFGSILAVGALMMYMTAISPKSAKTLAPRQYGDGNEPLLHSEQSKNATGDGTYAQLPTPDQSSRIIDNSR